MNALLSEIYSTIIPSAPYLIAAYTLVLIALFVYVFSIQRKFKAAEAQLVVLEEEVAKLTKEAAEAEDDAEEEDDAE